METNKEQLDWEHKLKIVKERINEFHECDEIKPQYKHFLYSLLHIMNINKLYSGSVVLPLHFFAKMFRGLGSDVFKMLTNLKEFEIITYSLIEQDIIVSIHENMYPYYNREEQIKKEEEYAKLTTNAIVTSDISEFAL